jgi:hypothetical protein
MQHTAFMQTGVVGHDTSLLRRFLAKMVIDVAPAALTSVIGGFLITQYQFSHAAALRPAAGQAAPASAEMMQLVRAEHTAIMDYLKTQAAEEQSRHDAEDAAKARAVAAEAEPDPAAELRHGATVPAAAKPGTRIKVAAATVLPPHAPLVIAQAEPDANAAPGESPAPQSKSLLAKTLDIKDHVVAATGNAAWTVVSAIGGLPSWIASIGDRRGDPRTTSS